MTTDTEKYSDAVMILIDDYIASWRKMPPHSDIPACAVIRSLQILKERVKEIPHALSDDCTELD